MQLTGHWKHGKSFTKKFVKNIFYVHFLITPGRRKRSMYNHLQMKPQVIAAVQSHKHHQVHTSLHTKLHTRNVNVHIVQIAMCPNTKKWNVHLQLNWKIAVLKVKIVQIVKGMRNHPHPQMIMNHPKWNIRKPQDVKSK